MENEIIQDNQIITDVYEDESGDTVIEVETVEELQDENNVTDNEINLDAVSDENVTSENSVPTDIQMLDNNEVVSVPEIETSADENIIDENISQDIIVDAATGEKIPAEEENSKTNDEEIINALRKIIEDDKTEYIQENEISTSETSETDNLENVTSLDAINTIDYSILLEDINSKLQDININNTEIQNLINQSVDNNTLSTKLNDLNVTNVLLIIIFISVLVNAVVNISRRIF